MRHHANAHLPDGSDPETDRPGPPFPPQRQGPPGAEGALRPQADHGETSYQGRGRLVGKVALITGGDSGIGKAVAIAFAREGADILISYLDEEEDAADTQMWVLDAGRRDIRVNAVAPGPVWTPLIPSSFPDGKVVRFGANTPLERPAQPAELAPIYVLLASEEASFTSGGIHEVTGGRPLT